MTHAGNGLVNIVVSIYEDSDMHKVDANNRIMKINIGNLVRHYLHGTWRYGVVVGFILDPCYERGTCRIRSFQGDIIDTHHFQTIKSVMEDRKEEHKLWDFHYDCPTCPGNVTLEGWHMFGCSTGGARSIRYFSSLSEIK